MSACNEEAVIAKAVLGARRHADAVLVVDDGSTDETAAIAEALGAIVIRHETSRGYGGALQTIFATARDLGAGELVIIDRHNPAEIPDLLAKLRQGNDVVIAGSDARGGSGAYGRRAIEVIRLNGGGMNAGTEILEQVRDLAVVGVPPAREPRYRGKRIAVVVPAYNEEALIGET
ncbi:MAG: glycosyltransferase, partial [Candidatus Methanoculleus thermohydrogenotrophicum]|nr:glycosyltransferase [Candidatus Methanoculleus thermohydrogenotrophicum]